MSQSDDLVQQAIAAYRAGQKDHSRNLLLQAIEINEHHELTWLWLSAVVDNLEEQQICLENVLALNPANDRARKGLEIVNRKIAEQHAATADEDELSLPDSAISFAPPRAPGGPIGAEFADMPGDVPLDGAPWAGTGDDANVPSQPVFEDWLSAAAHESEDLPFSADSGPATSVDWGRSGGPAAYGSGRQVELPSPQEYDEWVQGLNLNDSPKVARSTQKTEPPDFAPVNGGALDVIDGAEPSPPSSGTSPFTEDAFSGGAPTPAFDSSMSFDEDDWFTPEERARFGNVFTLDDEDDEPGSESFNFDFDADEPKTSPGESTDDDDEDERLSERLGASVGVAPAFSTPEMAAAVDREDYFSYIPAGIEAQSGISGRGMLLLAAIAVLLVLNALSFGLLFF